jgi:outer membrane lipoprotein-sorting protein
VKLITAAPSLHMKTRVCAALLVLLFNAQMQIATATEQKEAAIAQMEELTATMQMQMCIQE